MVGKMAPTAFPVAPVAQVEFYAPRIEIAPLLPLSKTFWIT